MLKNTQNFYSFSAAEVDPEVKTQNDQCKLIYGNCKSLEDISISYIAKCKTSANALTNTLGNLYTSQNMLDKVDLKVELFLNGTAR